MDYASTKWEQSPVNVTPYLIKLNSPRLMNTFTRIYCFGIAFFMLFSTAPSMRAQFPAVGPDCPVDYNTLWYGFFCGPNVYCYGKKCLDSADTGPFCSGGSGSGPG